MVVIITDSNIRTNIENYLNGQALYRMRQLVCSIDPMIIVAIIGTRVMIISVCYYNDRLGMALYRCSCNVDLIAVIKSSLVFFLLWENYSPDTAFCGTNLHTADSVSGTFGIFLRKARKLVGVRTKKASAV
jgi:hypothetical protein